MPQTQPQDSTGPIRPGKKAQKRSSVRELVGALVDAGVDKDKIVIERDSDGTLRVFAAAFTTAMILSSAAVV